MAVVPTCGDVNRWFHNAHQIAMRELSVPFLTRMWGKALPQQLSEDIENKLRIINEITPPEPARLLQEAMDPLQTCSFHPLGRVFRHPRVDIERGAHAQH